MGKQIRLSKNAEKIIAENTVFLPEDKLSIKVEYLLRDYLRLKQMCGNTDKQSFNTKDATIWIPTDTPEQRTDWQDRLFKFGFLDPLAPNRPIEV